MPDDPPSLMFADNGQPICGVCGYAAFATKGKDANGRYIENRDYTSGPLIIICVMCLKVWDQCNCLTEQPWLIKPKL